MQALSAQPSGITATICVLLNSINVISQTAYLYNFAERMGWGRTDWFLAVDRNGNNVIDNQSELFGQDATGSAWDKLRPYDTNNNGVISGTERNPLKIWIDADGDGVTDSGELKTLQQAGVASINLTNTGDHFFVGEHEIIGGGSWTKTAGGTGKYYDVFFKTDQLNSWYVGDDLTSPPEVDIETLFLPLSRGYGSIKSLHYAMTSDAALKAKVEERIVFQRLHRKSLSVSLPSPVQMLCCEGKI